MKFTTSSSFLISIPNTVNILYFRKNTKVAKFVLLSELLYILISQSRNYNKLYINLILQLQIIKKKLFQNIKDKILLSNGYNSIELFKLKLKKSNIDYDNFIKKILFFSNNISYLIKTIKKNPNLEVDSLFLKILNSLQKEFVKNNIYLKYRYLKKIQLYLKRNSLNKFKELSNFFYPVIFNLLKKETHRHKLKFIMRKLIRRFIFKGLNLELSKDKLQLYLLKHFKISNKYNIKLIPFIEEIHLKERKPLKMKRDIASNLKYIVDGLVSKFGFGYLKLLKMLKRNNLDSIPLSKFILFLNNLENSTIYGLFKNRGLDYHILLNNTDQLLNLNRNLIDIFNVNKLNNIYKMNQDYHSLFYKGNLNIYYLYNFFNSISKRRTKNFFSSFLDKQIEYFTLSPIRYYYYDQLYIQISNNEVNIGDLKNYIIIKKLLTYLKRYRTLFISINNIKKYFSNFTRNERQRHRLRGKRLKILNKNIILYFFRRLFNLYSNKLNINNNLSSFKDEGKKIFLPTKKFKLDYINKELKIVGGIIDFLSTVKSITFRFLLKKKREILNKLKFVLLPYLESFYYSSNEKNLYYNINYNKISLKEVSKINTHLNFSSQINEVLIYSKYQNIFKKYFSYLRNLIIKNDIYFYSNKFIKILNYSNEFIDWKNNQLLSMFKNRILENIPKYTSKVSNKNLYKENLNKKILSNKIFNINIVNEDVELENVSVYLINNLLSINRLIFNNSLISHLHNIYNYKIGKSFFSNKEVVISNKKFPVLLSSYKEKIIQKYNNSLYFINNSYEYGLKELNLEENFSLFLSRKLLFYDKIIKLSKIDKNIIYKNNILFVLDNNISERDYKKLNFSDLLKVSISFSKEDFNKILSKTISYTTTELKKMTKFQMKKKKLKKIY